jgi:hypothetical protein
MIAHAARAGQQYQHHSGLTAAQASRGSRRHQAHGLLEYKLRTAAVQLAKLQYTPTSTAPTPTPTPTPPSQRKRPHSLPEEGELEADDSDELEHQQRMGGHVGSTQGTHTQKHCVGGLLRATGRGREGELRKGIVWCGRGKGRETVTSGDSKETPNSK